MECNKPTTTDASDGNFNEPPQTAAGAPCDMPPTAETARNNGGEERPIFPPTLVVLPTFTCEFTEVVDCGNGEYLIRKVANTAINEDQRVLEYIKFHSGNPPQNGLNGIFVEDLIAVCIHRLQGFLNGPLASRETSLAVTKLEEAKHWLLARQSDREQRGVIHTYRK